MSNEIVKLEQCIILAAGKGSSALLPLFGHTSAAMLPLNGRPAIHWSLHYLLDLGIKQLTIGIRSDDDRLRRFITQSFGSRFKIEFIIPTKDRGPGFTLHECLKKVDSAKPVLVVLADTLFSWKDAPLDKSFVLTHPVEDSQRWCLARTETDGVVRQLTDKPESNPDNLQALIGVYHLANPTPAIQALDAAASRGNGFIQLSEALSPYVEAGQLLARQTASWSDCGNLDHFFSARRQVLQERAFNSIEMDELRGTITKRSTDSAKFLNEINYYRLLPPDLATFFPRVVGFSLRDKPMSLTLEYYSYRTLSELWVFEDVDAATWKRIFKGLQAVLKCFGEYQSNISVEGCRQVYWDKTTARVAQFAKQSPAFATLVDAQTLTINGIQRAGWAKIARDVEARARRIAGDVRGSIIHGDLCFANILYDRLTNLFKFIDPRGSFGDAGIYGDPRYDLAKLMHSIDGGYDLIIHEMFTVASEGTTISYQHFFPPTRTSALSAFREAFAGQTNLDDVRFIEGLLFVSMTPLHHDFPRRQLAMFAIGIDILNEVLYP